MIEIERLSKTYERAALPSLDDVTLAIGTGVFGLLGPNGAGKSTLMRILATLAAPSRGRAVVAGHDVRRERAAIRRLLGFLPQEFGFYPRLTAYETLDYLALLSGLGRERHARIEEALAIVRLKDVARKRVGAFSGGMKQRLGIAQALLNHPALLIVDEPTAGLDPVERVRFRTLLAELATRSTILLSTHIVADVASTCTDLAVLQQGRVVYRGTPEALAEQATGRVWAATVAPERLPEVERTCAVAAATATPRGLDVHLGGVDANISALTTPISGLAAPAPYRAALADLAIAWWMNQLPSRAVPTIVTPIHPSNPLPPDLSDGYASVTEQGGNSIVLPDYTGAAVAGQRLGSAFYEREMALRRVLAALGRHDVPNGHKLSDVVYLGKGPLARQLQALGLLGRLDDGGLAGEASPALDDLRRAIGAQRLRHALIDLSTAGATPNDDVSTACALYHLTGRPITAWVNHYLVSDAAIKPPGGCR